MQGKLRLNLHSLSVRVSELLEYRRKPLARNRYFEAQPLARNIEACSIFHTQVIQGAVIRQSWALFGYHITYNFQTNSLIQFVRNVDDCSYLSDKLRTKHSRYLKLVYSCRK